MNLAVFQTGMGYACRSAGYMTMVLMAGALFPFAAVNAQSVSAPANKIGIGVAEAVRQTGHARVMVMYSDDSESAPPVARSNAGRARSGSGTLPAADYEVYRNFRTIPAQSGAIHSEHALKDLASDPDVVRIDLDPGGRGTLDTTVPLIRAVSRHRQGVTGNGVVVALLDSGVDTDHVDLADSLDSQACFLDNDGIIDGIGLCPNGSDRQFGPGSAEDGAGHGTFTSGVITSDGQVSGVGVAPDADIVAIKVLDNSTFSGVFFYFSEIVAALDYIASQRPDVQVVNMSLGTFATFSGACDNSTAYNMAGAAVINRLRDQGVIAFASSGNIGSSSLMTSPACLSNVIAVGASDNFDELADFSNTNSETDLVAPGVGVESTGIGNTTVVSSGTSYSSAHAAGCAALLIESGEAVTPEEIETRMTQSTVMVTDPDNGLSFPRLDCGVNAPDHYLLYGLSHQHDDHGARGQEIHLSNSFGSGYFDIGTITRFGNPVDKNQEGINFEDLHYLMYRVRGESHRFRPMRIVAKNQFSDRILLETRKVDRIMVPASMSLGGSVDALADGSADAMSCYRLKRRRRYRGSVGLQDAFIADQLGEYKRFAVREPRRLCSPAELASDSGEAGIVNAENHLLCYRIRSMRHQPRHLPVWGIDVNSLLGPAVLETTKERELCVPTEVLSTRARYKKRGGKQAKR